MKALDQIPFSDTSRAKIETSLINYQRFAHLHLVFVLDMYVLRIQATQTAPGQSGRILTSDEITARVQGIFDGLMPEGFSYYITPKPYAS